MDRATGDGPAAQREAGRRQDQAGALCRDGGELVSDVTSQVLRVGLCGIGLDAYWPQFAGLKERLEGYVARVAERLERQA